MHLGVRKDITALIGQNLTLVPPSALDTRPADGSLADAFEDLAALDVHQAQSIIQGGLQQGELLHEGGGIQGIKLVDMQALVGFRCSQLGICSLYRYRGSA